MPEVEVPPQIHKDQYTQIWRQEGIPEKFIQSVSKIWEFLPAATVYAVVTDDGQAGVSFIRLGTAEYIKIHDWETLLDQRGFPIKSILEVNGGFLIRGIGSSVKHFYLAPRDLLFAIVGTLGGATIQTVRHILDWF